jgi:hypothetical protein
MTIRPFPLSLIAVAVLALAGTSAWAQDGRGHGRGQGEQGDQNDRGGHRIERMREAPRPRVMEARPRRQEQQRPRRDDGLADSVRRIERTTRGRVINAERVQSDGRNINRIKVMDDRGRIRVYMDDPQARRGAPTRGDDN